MTLGKRGSYTDRFETQLFLRPLSDLTTRIHYFRRLERTWQLIENEYADPSLSLERAARASGLNKNHLNVLLRRTTSLTFHQLLVRYRLFKAIDLMTTKNYSLLEISLETGFGGLNTFERNFRRILGIAPHKFKSQWTSM